MSRRTSSSSSSKGSSGFSSSSRSSGYGAGTSSSGYSNTMAVRLAEFKMDALGSGGSGASHAGHDTTVDPESLTPEDYLDRFGITAYLREAVNLVLENRPQAPVEFLSEYFRNAVQGSSYLHRAYRFVRMTDRDRPSFMGNVVKAHRVLSRRKGSVGVTGEEMHKLLGLLCHDLPTAVSEAVLGTVLKHDASPSEIIEFDTFFLSIKVCLLFEEQVEFARRYFETLCVAEVASGEAKATTPSAPPSLPPRSPQQNEDAATAASSATENAPRSPSTDDSSRGKVDTAGASPSSSQSTKESLPSGAKPTLRPPLPSNIPGDQRTDVNSLIKYLQAGNSGGELGDFSEIEKRLREAAAAHPSGRVSMDEFVDAFAGYLVGIGTVL